MLQFRELVLEDKEWINELLKSKKHLSCEFCFGNHFIWRKTYNIKVCRINDYYTLALFNDEGEKGISFLFPQGYGDIRPVIEQLIQFCEEKGYQFRAHSADQDEVAALEKLFPGKFDFSSDRDYCDYIYNVEDLIKLSGKKYHGKRNHIARFKDQNWSFEPITRENMQECIQMNTEWCKENDCGRDESLKEECCAVRASFKNFYDLDLFGGLLRLDGKVVAYTIGERLSDETVVVHIEKAFSEIQGAYPTINREFVANMCSNYKYVNREEDLGVEGLRRAKLSYKPAILLEKFTVRLKNGATNTASEEE